MLKTMVAIFVEKRNMRLEGKGGTPIIQYSSDAFA